MSELVYILGSALLHFLWQGILIGFAAALMLRGAARQTARRRYSICLLALLACAVAPVVTIWALFDSSGGTMQVAVGAIPRHVELALPSVGQIGGAVSVDVSVIIVTLWLSGALLMAIRQGVEWRQLTRLQKLAAPLDALAGSFAEIATRALEFWSLSHIARVAVSHVAKMPMVVGWWRPAIVFPAALLARMSPTEFELILWHEIAHILRRDPWVNAFQVVLEIAFFYHPAVRWISKRARLERECACDDFVVARCGSAYIYAQALASVALPDISKSLLTVAATNGDLVPRLRYLAGDCAADPLPRPHAGWVFAALILICTLWALPLKSEWSGLGVGSAANIASLAAKTSLRAVAQITRHIIDAPTLKELSVDARLSRWPTWSAESEADVDASSSQTERTEPMDIQLNDRRFEQSASDGQISSNSAVQQESSTASSISGSPLVPVHTPLPQYPIRARLDGIEGVVNVVLRIGSNGQPIGLQMVDAQPLGVFEKNVRQALMRWRYEPAATGTASSGGVAAYRLQFSLAGVSATTTSNCAAAVASLTCGTL